MAELLFKRGLHTNLPDTAIDGAFYLTTDTHRLYAGIGSELVDLNKYILIYASFNELMLNWTNAEQGDFAYVIEENVLAYYTGVTWQQINKNSDTKNNKFNKSGIENVLTLELEDTNEDKVSVDLLFIGTGGVDVDVNTNGDITITGTTYDLETKLDSTTTFTVTLSNSKENTDDETDFVLQAGSNVSFSGAGDNGIVINSHNTMLSEKGNTAVADGEGNLIVTIKDTDGTEAVATAKEAFYYNVAGVTVYNQNDLPVYSKEEIDDKLNTLNPMVYRGPVGSLEVLASKEDGAKNGDTYMATENFTGPNGESVEKGDLFIATGDTESDGVLTDVVWTYIPAGDDTHIDTRYKATANKAEHSITVKDTTADDIMMIIDLNGDDDKIVLESEVTSEGDEGSNNVLTTTIKHAAPGAGSITADNGDEHKDALVINVPTDFVIDSTGHVASYKEDIYTLATYELSGATAEVDNNVATIVSTLESSDGTDRGSATIVLDASANDNIVLTASNNIVTMQLEWGTF